MSLRSTIVGTITDDKGMQICTARDACERKGDGVLWGSNWDGIDREGGKEAGNKGKCELHNERRRKIKKRGSSPTSGRRRRWGIG